MTKEIITLQLGNYANYVGTHWWNIQESSFVYKEDANGAAEINHDVLYREGHNSREITFTPRLVFADFSESLGSLAAEGTLYNSNGFFPEEEEIPWDNKVEVHRSAVAPQNEFLCDLYEDDKRYENGFAEQHVDSKYIKPQKCNKMQVHANATKKYRLDKNVHTWTDFKKVHYHPQSTLLLNQQNSDTFGSWITGEKEAKLGKTFSLMEESIRFYAEECDNMQGFHVLCDVNTGFGGYTSFALEYLHDEFPGKCCAVFPTSQTLMKSSNIAKVRDSALSTLLTLSGLLENSSFVCPLSLCEDIFKLNAGRSFPHLIYDAASNYHTSAVIAACLEGSTRPYRLNTNPSNLLHLSQSMTSGNQRLLGLSSALPLPFDLNRHTCLADLFCDYHNADPWVSITPNFGELEVTKIPEHCFSQAVTLNGVLEPYSVATVDHAKYNDTLIHKCRDSNAVVKLYLESRFPTSTNVVSTIHEPIKVSTPFPDVFSKNVLLNGYIKCQKMTAGVFSDLNTDAFQSECSSGSTIPNSKEANIDLCGSASVGDTVESIPALTNLKSSTHLVPLLKRCCFQATVLKRWASQNRHSDYYHEYEALMEAEEKFRTLQQDYSILTIHNDSDNSD